jgi:hypothetical protein
MKSIRNSLVAGSCQVFGLALLVFSATAGGSAVRAADPSILQNVVFDPIAQIVLRVEQRVADLEATVASFAESFTSERIVAQELCVADGSGAQTCITKAQLDALLSGATQVGQASATRESGTPLAAFATVMAPATEPVEAVIAATAKPETVIAVEQPAKNEEPTPAGPAMANSPAPTLSAVPLEQQARERLE